MIEAIDLPQFIVLSCVGMRSLLLNFTLQTCVSSVAAVGDRFPF
ncbi:MAG TPA: hypothetical protein V6D14_08760 [Coleofasciculaceae cyanobacterium]